LDQFFNLLRRGGKFQKLEILKCFILDYTSFLKLLCISEKFFWEKERKKEEKKERKKKEIS